MKIIFSGGGTLGSVSPLVAVYEVMKKQNLKADILWIGTKNGPEQKFITEYGISFRSISSGKMRRYFSFKNIFTPWLVFIGFLQSLRILRKWKADIVISSGSFVSVPLVWAAQWLRIKTIIHQQDVVMGLANKLTRKSATKITVALEVSLKDFPKGKTQVIGNPVREDVFGAEKEKSIEFFHFQEDLPVVLILGGGTGAAAINQLVLQSLNQLVEFCQIIHCTGKNKADIIATHSRYRSYEFITKDMRYTYGAADIVVCRAGMSTLSELCELKKSIIIIPIPQSHQAENALYFAKNNAAIVLDQKSTPQDFVDTIRKLLNDPALAMTLRRNIGKILLPQAAQRFIDIIYEL